MGVRVEYISIVSGLNQTRFDFAPCIQSGRLTLLIIIIIIVAVCDDVVHVFSLIALYYNTGIDKNVIFITVATSPTM